MNALHQIELPWIEAIQGDGALVRVMIWISYLGSEALPGIVAALFFLRSRSEGARLLLWLSFGACLTHLLKLGFHLPRPYMLGGGVKALVLDASYGLPSGHAVMAAIVWIFLAETFRRTWFWVVAILVTGLVGVSRVYLGLHFISDVLVGLALACTLLWCSIRSDTIQRHIGAMGSGLRLCAAIGLTTILFGAGLLTVVTIGNSASLSALSVGDLERLFRWAGCFLGAASGLIAAEHWARFEENEKFWRKLLALSCAFAGAFAIRGLFNVIPSGQSEWLKLAMDFLYGGVMTTWLTLLAPLLLITLGLLRSAMKKEQEAPLLAPELPSAEHRGPTNE